MTNTIEITIRANNQASRALESAAAKLGDFGSSLTRVGASITAATAPLALGLGAAVNVAMQFEEAMTNAGAVLGRSAEDMADLNAQVLAIGENSRAGPQAAAEAFYDIVSGVADASAHMAILEASIATAEAGSADLAGTTAALISVMNSYGFSADKAGFASDVLTQVVGKGVGTMDEFAAALPMVTGLANSMGIAFEDLGGQVAYLTTQGYTASQATTQMRAMMIALLNPNEKLKKALEEIGAASGQAAVDQYGLVGTFAALRAQSQTFQDNMAGALGSVEALAGVTALTSETALEAIENFSVGLEGATERAQAIQLRSAAAQFDLLKSSVSGMAITVGETLLPVLNDLVGQIRPVIQSVTEWMRENPEVTRTVVALAAGLVTLGPILVMVGVAISGVGAVLGALGAVVGVVLSPIGLLVGAIAALVVIFKDDILRVLQPVIDAFGTFFGELQSGVGFGEAIKNLLFNLLPEEVVNGIIGAVERIGEVLSGIWDAVRPALESLAKWFIEDALPSVVNFIRDEVIPRIEGFIQFLAGVWDAVRPGLEALAKWFIEDALPGIAAFVEETVMPAVQAFIDLLSGIWTLVGTALGQVADWFLSSAAPAIVNFLERNVMPAVQGIINLLSGIWDAVRPALEALFGWFRDTFTQIGAFIQDLIDKIENLKGGLSAWQGIGDNANTIGQGLASGQWNLGDVIGAAVGAIGAELRADGGPVRMGQTYIVGERGPEVFIPRSSGMVIPNGGGGTVFEAGAILINANGMEVSEARQMILDVMYSVMEGDL